MRMEELSDSQYIKGTDSVERYLLGLVKAYFENSNVAEPASREFIIRRAVARMKEEFRYENIGVLSVTLADGIARTGPVNITLADLGAEPAITPKLSAFNVDFGDKANTACEGNDSRLSDARDPKPHSHNIKDINGLEGRLSTLLSLINRVGSYGHVHTNSAVLDKIVYTGTATTIDLNFIDTIEPDIQKKLDDIRDRINKTINETVPNEIAKISKRLDNISTKIAQAEALVKTNQDKYLKQSKDYTDSKIPSCLDQFQNATQGYATKDDLKATTVDALSYIGSMLCSASRMVDQTPGADYATYRYGCPIPDDILRGLEDSGTDLEDCIIDIYVRRSITVNGQKEYEWVKAPYIYLNSSGDYKGIVMTGIDYDKKEVWFSYKMTAVINKDTGIKPQMPSEIKQLTMETKIFAKRKAS